jgi:hypothetical protein
MISSPQELQALQCVAELEPPLAMLEAALAGLAQALCGNDVEAVEQRAAELHRSLAQAVGHFADAARAGGVPGPLRHRLALATGRVAAQREALARATASLDRAIDVLLPSHPLHTAYGANGVNERNAQSGSLLV